MYTDRVSSSAQRCFEVHLSRKRGKIMVVIWWRYIIDVIFRFSKIIFLVFLNVNLTYEHLKTVPCPSQPAPLVSHFYPFQTWRFSASLGLHYASQQRISWDGWNLQNRFSVVFWCFFSYSTLHCDIVTIVSFGVILTL